MAIITVPPFLWPPLIGNNSGAWSISSTGFTIDAADEVIAAVFKAPKAGNIRSIQFRVSTVTTATTGSAMLARVETVDPATGFPNGIWAANTSVNFDILAGDANVIKKPGNFTASATVARGDIFAVTITNPTTGFGNFILGRLAEGFTSMFPYAANFTTSWAKSTTPWAVSIEYDDGTFMLTASWAGAVLSTAATSYNSSSATNERGAKFRFPVGLRVAGGYFHLDSELEDVDFKLYDSDGTTLLVSPAPRKDKDIQTGTVSYMVYFDFGTSVVLNANTYYRLTAAPVSTANINLQEIKYDSNAVLDCLLGGKDFFLATKTSGAWDADSGLSMSRPIMGLVIDGLDDGAGGGTVVAAVENTVITRGMRAVGY